MSKKEIHELKKLLRQISLWQWLEAAAVMAALYILIAGTIAVFG